MRADFPFAGGGGKDHLLTVRTPITADFNLSSGNMLACWQRIPVLSQLTPKPKVFINAEPAAMILDLANAVYGMLLRCLVQTYAKSATAAGPEKERMLSAAIDLMRGPRWPG